MQPAVVAVSPSARLQAPPPATNPTAAQETMRDGGATVPATALAESETSKERRSGLVVAFYIACWFLANGTTVLLNKYIFKMMGFRFPLCLTLIHMTVQSVLAHLTVDYLQLVDKVQVERKDYFSKLLVIAAVFCANICLGNISLRFVPVSFMQTIKSLTPVATALLQFLIFRSRLTGQAMLALIPVTGGVAMASATELSFHLGGFIAALVACFLTGLKFVLSSQMLSGRYKLDSINLLYYMAPPSAAILLPLVGYFESAGIMAWIYDPARPTQHFIILLVSALVSFALNVSLFIVLKATSSIAVTICGNVKTVGVILTSIVIFRNPVGPINMLGCFIAISGCCWYGLIKKKWATMGTMETTAPAPAVLKTDLKT